MDRAGWRWGRWRNRQVPPERWRRPVTRCRIARPWQGKSSIGSLFRVACGRAAGLRGLAEEELADQVFQDHSRLRGGNVIALHQILVVGPGLDADVLLSQQAAGEDLHRAVL